MIVNLEDVESTGGVYWLMIVTLEDVESTGGVYWWKIVTLEDVKSTGGVYWSMIVTLEDVESTGGGYSLERVLDGESLSMYISILYRREGGRLVRANLV